jgi:hypothetical protein
MSGCYPVFVPSDSETQFFAQFEGNLPFILIRIFEFPRLLDVFTPDPRKLSKRVVVSRANGSGIYRKVP